MAANLLAGRRVMCLAKDLEFEAVDAGSPLMLRINQMIALKAGADNALARTQVMRRLL